METFTLVNKSISRPLLIFEVERRLVLVNTLLCFTLLAVLGMQVSTVLFIGAVYLLIHLLLMTISRDDPFWGSILKRSSKYYFLPVYAPIHHPSRTSNFRIQSVSRPS